MSEPDGLVLPVAPQATVPAAKLPGEKDRPERAAGQESPNAQSDPEEQDRDRCAEKRWQPGRHDARLACARIRSRPGVQAAMPTEANLAHRDADWVRLTSMRQI